jgi:hypothetical protein
MTRAALSIFVFGLYLVLLGATLMIAPGPILGVFGFSATGDVWIRVAGALVVIIGWFFLVSARHGTESFFRATLLPRPFLFLSLCAYVLFGLAPPQLVLFGAIDLIGAAWTLYALRRTRR